MPHNRGGTARAFDGLVLPLACPLELRGSVFSRIDDVERFWSVAHGKLVGWSPTRRTLEVDLDGHGSHVITIGGNHVVVLVERKDATGHRARRLWVADARDGHIVATRAWSGAGCAPGVAVSRSGATIAHGDGRSLFVWRVEKPTEDHVPALRGTPRWVSDNMDCLVDDGSRWRFYTCAGGETQDVKLADVPSHASWSVANDLSVATSREGLRALIRTTGSTLSAELSECPGLLAPGPNGCVAAIRAAPGGAEQKLYVIDRMGKRLVLGKARSLRGGADWRTLAFSSDGERLAVLHAARVEIHTVPR
jgi:hypothetical protein